MLGFSDPRWNQLECGYRVRYDPRPALAKLQSGVDVAAAWEVLWQELHHQGDVGVVSAPDERLSPCVDMHASIVTLIVRGGSESSQILRNRGASAS